MEYKDPRKGHLTNEHMKQKFKNQFDMVNYAIQLAENMIRSGRDARVKAETQNRALQVILEIATGQDRFDEIIPKVEEEEVTYQANGKVITREATSRTAKRTRKALVD